MLRIRLFGAVDIRRDSGTDGIRLPASAQALLAFLVLNRHRSYPREVLADQFWQHVSTSQARHCLSTALWRLRRALEPAADDRGSILQTTASGEVGFTRESGVWLDVAEFEHAVRWAQAQPGGTLAPAAADRFEAALGVYTGDLLEGFYQDWATQERERLRGLYLDGLTLMMRAYRGRGDQALSLEVGNRILRIDPLREDVHREVIQLHLAAHRHGHAVRQYAYLCELLAAELGIGPTAETDALMAGFPPARPLRVHAPAVSRPRSPVSDRRARRNLRAALEEFDRARSHLLQALELIEPESHPSRRRS